MKCDHNKRMITLTSDNIKRLSLYLFQNRTKDITFFSVNFKTLFSGVREIIAGMESDLD